MKAQFKVTVHVAPADLTVADVETTGKVGVPLDLTVPTSGGTPPLEFQLAPDAVLPPGLGFSATGELQGTPTQAGDFTFSAQAVDANG